MYKKFMDEKAQQIFERLCNKVVNGEFDEDDIYEFYIFHNSSFNAVFLLNIVHK